MEEGVDHRQNYRNVSEPFPHLTRARVFFTHSIITVFGESRLDVDQQLVGERGNRRDSGLKPLQGSMDAGDIPRLFAGPELRMP
jgi:hypothetical protein